MSSSMQQKAILIALIVTLAIPTSMARRELISVSDIESYLRDLCSATKKPEACWKIIEPELSRFTDTDTKSVVGVTIDMAIEKCDEIRDKLDGLHDDSNDDNLKGKYMSCSKDYQDARRELDVAKQILDSDDYKSLSAQVDDVDEELKSCKRQFGRDSFDPARVRNRNKEFGRYVEIVKVATDRLCKENDQGP